MEQLISILSENLLSIGTFVILVFYLLLFKQNLLEWKAELISKRVRQRRTKQNSRNTKIRQKKSSFVNTTPNNIPNNIPTKPLSSLVRKIKVSN